MPPTSRQPFQGLQLRTPPYSLLFLLLLFPMKTHLSGALADLTTGETRRPGQPALWKEGRWGAFKTLTFSRVCRPADATNKVGACIKLRGQSRFPAFVLNEAVGGSNWFSLWMTATDLPRMITGMCLPAGLPMGTWWPLHGLGSHRATLASCLPLLLWQELWFVCLRALMSPAC